MTALDRNNMTKIKTTRSNASSTMDILGKLRHSIPNICCVCNKKIPVERIRALINLGIHETRWTHTKCSTTTKIQGIYMEEPGTSELRLCNKVYNDSVRHVFRTAETDSGDETD